MSEENLKLEKVQTLNWKTADLVPTPRKSFSKSSFLKKISNKEGSTVSRNRTSYMYTWMERLEKQIPIVLSSLHLNNVRILNLPAECFIEYQLRAQEIGKNNFVATAAYGDGGPWYIPVKEEYPNGGYEVGVAFSEPTIDSMLTEGIKQIL